MDIKQLFEQFKTYLIDNDVDVTTLELAENKTDFSIKITGTIIFKYKPGKKGDYVFIKKSYQDKIFERYDITLCKFVSSFVCIPAYLIDEKIADFMDLLLIVVAKILGRFWGYGCCHRYIECSNQKKCIHPSKIDALSCMYKKNLEKGLIFYGDNKTI